MAARIIPTPEELGQLLRLEPETGRLFWIKREAKWFRDDAKWTADQVCRRFNTKYAGTEAFTALTAGYPSGNLLGHKFQAHRVIWALFFGEWPVDEIDHIDGNRANNCIRNLRQATRSQNGINTRLKSDNTSGLKGVSWHKAAGKWSAEIHCNKKKSYLGLFNTKDEAFAAYTAAALTLHGEFARASIAN